MSSIGYWIRCEGDKRDLLKEKILKARAIYNCGVYAAVMKSLDLAIATYERMLKNK